MASTKNAGVGILSHVYDFGLFAGETLVNSNNSTHAVVFGNVGDGAAVGVSGSTSGAVTFTKATESNAVKIIANGATDATGVAVTNGTVMTATSATIESTAGAVASKLGTVDLNAGVTADANKITSLTVNAGSDLTVKLAADDYADTATMTVTGAGKATLGSGFDGATINAAANTGGLVIETTANTKTVTGSTAADTVTFGESVVANGSIDLGAGNDKLLYSAGTLASTVTLDGGAGTDTIAAPLLSAANQARIKNFEVIDLKDASGTYDVSLFTASNLGSLTATAGIKDAATTGKATVQGLAGTAVALSLAGSTVTTYGDITAKLASAAGTSDTATITFANTSKTAVAETLTAFTSSGIETASIVSGGVTGATNTVTNYADTLNTLSSITVTGAKAFTLTDVDVNTAQTTATANVQAALQTIDASAATGNVDITAGEDDLITGSFYTVYDGLTIKIGTGVANTVVNGAKNGVVVGNSGVDTITLSGKGASASTGAGVDDQVTFNNTNQSANFDGAGKDIAVIGANAKVTDLASIAMTKLTNVSASDTINVTAFDKASAIANVTTDVSGAASLQAALDIAANDAGTLAFFNWVDGNTYIVADDTVAGTVLTTADAVIELVGTYTSFTATAGVILVG